MGRSPFSSLEPLRPQSQNIFSDLNLHSDDSDTSSQHSRQVKSHVKSAVCVLSNLAAMSSVDDAGECSVSSRATKRKNKSVISGKLFWHFIKVNILKEMTRSDDGAGRSGAGKVTAIFYKSVKRREIGGRTEGSGRGKGATNTAKYAYGRTRSPGTASAQYAHISRQ